MYQIDVRTLYTSEVVSGFINVGDLCLGKDHVVGLNVALESPASGQNNTIKYYLTTAFSNNSKHNVSLLYCGLSQDGSKLQLVVGEGVGVGVWSVMAAVLHFLPYNSVLFISCFPCECEIQNLT